MPIDRRTALALLGAGVLSTRLEAAQRHLHALAARPTDYQLQFFTAAENALLDRVAERILPADDHSPGAHEAKVSSYIDLLVANSPESTQANWKARLKAFETLAVEKHGKPFVELADPEQAALLNLVSANEKNPRSPAERFFADVKKTAVFAYYTTSIGLLQELGYKGNQALASFPGCPAG